MNDWLIIGALGLLFMILIQLGQQSLDIQSGSDDQTIVSSHSLQN